MKGRILLSIVLVLAIAGGVGAVKVQQIKLLIATGKAYAPPPESVAAGTVREEQWQETLAAIGTLTAVQGVNVTPELGGPVREIAFESGATVAKGDLLVRLDTTSEEAQLRAIEAQVELARLNLDRARTLRSENTVAQAELDTAEATLKQNQANADNIRATITKKTIRAPFAGRLGIRLVNLGQYLEAGKPIVSLQSLAPIHADFALPQQNLSRLQMGMAVRLTTDAYPGREFAGQLTASNPDLDPATRSITLQATVDNADQALRPGMFARVEVILPGAAPRLVIPSTAVLSTSSGSSVYLIESQKDPEGKSHLAVRQQTVRTGRTRGDFISVESGLKTGDRIVTSGLFKLRNGMAVEENNTLTPKSESAPHPSDT